jgi:Flp pilus assembly protein TadG
MLRSIDMQRPSRPSIKPRGTRRGATTVEMALVAPALFTLVFGSFEIAHGFMVQHLIQDAARQGCRAGVCPNRSNTDIQSAVNVALEKEGLTGATTTVFVNSVAGDVSSAESGDDVQVRITLPGSNASLFPGSGYLMGQLTASYALRRE